MRIIYFEIDALRADHLGCYGYLRNTSPNIDKIAKEGVMFTNYYCSDAPCLPSRTALFTGQFGIRNGVVNHDGEASQLRIDKKRKFRSELETDSLVGMLRNKGLYTCGISSFASRHSAWHTYCGYNEIHDSGKYGNEIANDVIPIALNWLTKNKDMDHWYLQINLFDPHTPYRTPLDYGHPFKDEPIPNWITEEVLERHKELAGPHCAQEINMYNDHQRKGYPLQPGRLDSMSDVLKLFDGYDLGISYADMHIGKVLDLLKEQGILEDTVIIISADHGENMGELGIYSEHCTANDKTCRIPMIIKWPGGLRGHIDEAFHYNLDLVPTLAELLNIKPSISWDGLSYAKSILTGEKTGHEYLVISQMAHVCQRGVRYKDWQYIRTYHDGFHFFPKHMLFNLREDPYEQNDLANIHPEIVNQLSSLLFDWQDEMMKRNNYQEDVLNIVMREGGPFHVKGKLQKYLPHLIKTGREKYIEKYKTVHPEEFID